MKKKLQISAMCLAAVAVLIVIFPFRTATFKMPGKVDSSASLGPTFILSNPSKASIYEAVWGKQLKNPEDLSYSMAYQSEIDYGRTLLLMLPFAIGATALLTWMRKGQD
jgi:hypothetical protein